MPTPVLDGIAGDVQIADAEGAEEGGGVFEGGEVDCGIGGGGGGGRGGAMRGRERGVEKLLDGCGACDVEAEIIEFVWWEECVWGCSW